MDANIQSSINTIIANVTIATHDFKQLQRRILYIICEAVLAMVLIFINPLTPNIPKSTMTLSIVGSIIMIGVFISLSIVSSREVTVYHERKESFMSKYHDKDGNPIHTMDLDKYLQDVEEFSEATERFIRIYKIVNTANLVTALLSMVMLFFTIASSIML